ncbi:Dabb family protein [Actinomycetospora straminea]|uniref:Stress-response A/B barrel domain-containing protein n=1 Tax=Actinomycetospora straminea TaxID=663607 RepID=A0ABP9EUP8_9PSEU|nr:Dabb family protein [Actinomycetospora straminea]MDD7934828.1 Dabb family protein [Actinomycetospora straminea]
MTFTHVVTFSWTGQAAEDPSIPDGIAETLRRWIADADLKGLRSWTCGRDAGLAEVNADFAVVAVFDDMDSYLAYRDDAEHRRIIVEDIAPHVGQRTSVQFAG